jgi:hypothetical protein
LALELGDHGVEAAAGAGALGAVVEPLADLDLLRGLEAWVEAELGEVLRLRAREDSVAAVAFAAEALACVVAGGGEVVGDVDRETLLAQAVGERAGGVEVPFVEDEADLSVKVARGVGAERRVEIQLRLGEERRGTTEQRRCQTPAVESVLHGHEETALHQGFSRRWVG